MATPQQPNQHSGGHQPGQNEAKLRELRQQLTQERAEGRAYRAALAAAAASHAATRALLRRLLPPEAAAILQQAEEGYRQYARGKLAVSGELPDSAEEPYETLAYSDLLYQTIHPSEYDARLMAEYVRDVLAEKTEDDTPRDLSYLYEQLNFHAYDEEVDQHAKRLDEAFQHSAYARGLDLLRAQIFVQQEMSKGSEAAGLLPGSEAPANPALTEKDPARAMMWGRLQRPFQFEETALIPVLGSSPGESADGGSGADEGTDAQEDTDATEELAEEVRPEHFEVVVTTQALTQRLDEVAGPENWSLHVRAEGERQVSASLTIAGATRSAICRVRATEAEPIWVGGLVGQAERGERTSLPAAAAASDPTRSAGEAAFRAAAALFGIAPMLTGTEVVEGQHLQGPLLEGPPLAGTFAEPDQNAAGEGQNGQGAQGGSQRKSVLEARLEAVKRMLELRSVIGSPAW
jgi:hypothetical protein